MSNAKRSWESDGSFVNPDDVLEYGNARVLVDRERIVKLLANESLTTEHGEVYVSELLCRLCEIVREETVLRDEEK